MSNRHKSNDRGTATMEPAKNDWPFIPVSDGPPPEGQSVMAWYDNDWHEAAHTKFWSGDQPEWRSWPAGTGITPTHYMLMPPNPTEKEN